MVPDPGELKAWRKSQRARLLAERRAVAAGTLERWRLAMDASLLGRFASLREGVVAFCWPILGEYDARHLARHLREHGAVTALPVVVAPRTPLVFREWRPGVRLETGALEIPYPAESPEVAPDAVLLPMNGWDAGGYRLGYGAGFFDRTLAALARRPLVIGVTYEMARMDSIRPQAWDIPVDAVVTERGVYRRGPDGRLAFEG